jgi:hypothetical protein
MGAVGGWPPALSPDQGMHNPVSKPMHLAAAALLTKYLIFVIALD